jgi:hypothetical protein
VVQQCDVTPAACWKGRRHQTSIEDHSPSGEALESHLDLRGGYSRRRACSRASARHPVSVHSPCRAVGTYAPCNWRDSVIGRTGRRGQSKRTWSGSGGEWQRCAGLIGVERPRSWPQLGTWLAAGGAGQVFRNRSASNGYLRLSRRYTVRPSRAERIERAFPLPCFLAGVPTYSLAAGSWRPTRYARRAKPPMIR